MTQPTTFDVAIERLTGTGDTVLDEFDAVSKLMNVPGMQKVRVTYPDGSTETSPCGRVVSVKPHEETDE